MPNFVVNHRAQSNGDHEVHKEGCPYFPSSYKSIGWHGNSIPQWPKQKEPTNSQMDVSIAAQLVIQVEIGKADRDLLLSHIPLSF